MNFKTTFWAVALGVAAATVVVTPVATVAVHKIIGILAARRARMAATAQ